MPSYYKEFQKDLSSFTRKPNLVDYVTDYGSWSWDRVWKELGRPKGLVILAHVCIDRHANGANADKTLFEREIISSVVTPVSGEEG